jgi:hypothetical protein
MHKGGHDFFKNDIFSNFAPRLNSYYTTMILVLYPQILLKNNFRTSRYLIVKGMSCTPLQLAIT